MMKRRMMFLLVLLITTGLVSAQQNSAFKKGDNLLNLGIGLNSYYEGGNPFGLSYERGINDAISVGPNIDYLSHKYGSFRYTVLYAGVRGSYHFNELLKLKNDKIDLYGGLTLGFNSYKWEDTQGILGKVNSSDVYLGAYAGGKYYFAKAIGVFAELGAIGSTNARVGIAFKF